MVIGVHCYPKTQIIAEQPIWYRQTPANGRRLGTIPSQKYWLQLDSFAWKANKTSCCQHTVAPSHSVEITVLALLFMTTLGHVRQSHFRKIKLCQISITNGIFYFCIFSTLRCFAEKGIAYTHQQITTSPKQNLKLHIQTRVHYNNLFIEIIIMIT